MNILILGGDGYLGWPTAMHFASLGHNVCVIDNYMRRNIAQSTSSEPLFFVPNLNDRAEIFKSVTGKHISVIIGDCTDYRLLTNTIKDFSPDTVVHYAEQPSAPYSMTNYESAHLTLNNNLNTTFNLIWAVMENAPDCHIVKLGTMGEYGTPNIDIEEGWLDITHNGRQDKFLYPRQAGSLYHTTKIMDTDLMWLGVRMWDLKVTDLMQGPVYGIETDESSFDKRLNTIFNYDEVFGTIVNRFIVQAVVGYPLTVYGSGGQTRGYLNIKDTLQCVHQAEMIQPKKGELRIFNQIMETFSVNDLANLTKKIGNQRGVNVEIKSVQNPRKESENHYYNPKYQGLKDLGISPNLLTDEVMGRLFSIVEKYKKNIRKDVIFKGIKW